MLLTWKRNIFCFGRHQGVFKRPQLCLLEGSLLTCGIMENLPGSSLTARSSVVSQWQQVSSHRLQHGRIHDQD